MRDFHDMKSASVVSQNHEDRKVPRISFRLLFRALVKVIRQPDIHILLATLILPFLKFLLLSLNLLDYLDSSSNLCARWGPSS